jgi:ketosteroid isomerase-like protein
MWVRLQLVLLLAASIGALAYPCPTNQPKTPRALEEAEHSWAKALERHDTATLACLLADEFQDVDPDGHTHDRAATIAAVATRKPGNNQLSELQAHIQGDGGYIRGLATLVDPQGNVRARVRFTDIYLYRDGRWQCVAGQESLVNEKTP